VLPDVAFWSAFEQAKRRAAIIGNVVNRASVVRIISLSPE